MVDIIEDKMDILAFLKGRDGTTVLEVAGHFGKNRNWASVRLNRLHEEELVSGLKEVRGQGMPSIIYRIVGGE